MAKIYTNSEWVSYTPRFYAPILTANPLNGIDTNTDTLNLSTGACTRVIKKLVLDSTTTFTKGGSGDSSYFALNLGDSTGALCVCSHFINTPITASNTDVGASVTSTSQNLRIRPDNVDQTTETDFNTWIADQYTNGTPVTIWYVLATATTETVTVPEGLSGTVEGFTTQSTTPTATVPVYPTCNDVITWTNKADEEYTNGSWQ